MCISASKYFPFDGCVSRPKHVGDNYQE